MQMLDKNAFPQNLKLFKNVWNRKNVHPTLLLFIFVFPNDMDDITDTTDEATEETVKGFV